MFERRPAESSLAPGPSHPRCLEWRKITRQALDLELEDPLRPIDVLEPKLAQIAQADVRREVVLDKLAGRVREQHLSAMPGPADAGRTVDAETDVTALGGDGLARVDSHSHTELHSLGPPVPGERALRCDRRGDRIARAAEGDEERIALGVDLLTAVRLEGLAQEAFM